MDDLVNFLRSQAAFEPEAGGDERSWCGKMTAAADEIERLREDLKQIACVCRDNAAPECNQKMALEFVLQIATK